MKRKKEKKKQKENNLKQPFLFYSSLFSKQI